MISSKLYGVVLIINNLSSKSTGKPWGLEISVPLIYECPLFVAKITIGANVDSNALFKNVNASISSIWHSSINNTPGTNSAIP